MQPDEFIMLMDWPNGSMSLDDYKRLRDAGVRTAYAWLSWDIVEPKPGQYDWSYYDDMAERYRQAGMKFLLLCHDCAADWGPVEWYSQGPGKLWRRAGPWHYNEHYTVISPWCLEGQAAELDFMRHCVAHYAGSNVFLIRGSFHGGELVLPGNMPSWLDPCAIASYRTFVGDYNAMPADLPTYASMAAEPATVAWLRQSLSKMITAQQQVLMGQPSREVWFLTPERNTPFAESQESGPRSCNWVAREMFDTLPGELDAVLSIMFFQVFRSDGTQGTFDRIPAHVGKVWAGSQYCEGLLANTAEALRLGLRGFITGPLHLEGSHGGGHLEPWMVDAFRTSLAQWQAARS